MRLPEILESWIPLDGTTRLFGEVLLSRCSESKSFKAKHLADGAAAESGLDLLDSVPAVREMAKYSVDGEYRPLKTAPTLKSGWLILDPKIDSFFLKLDAIYPAAFAGSVRYFEGTVKAVPLRETLNRQTGMYQFAKNITDAQANQIMRETCSKGCLRKIAWPLDDKCPVSQLPAPNLSIPLVCTEACTFAVTEARRLAREAYDKLNAKS